ncbi:hypothetical protein PIB30_068236 [Stylosanthes scabra]|uniref:Uncharacterized protein n=1 Tax=Stylosanthes scabra TaxID=79078 RepID=A0ABU6QMD8_9FABA|nr:hypothetical protein [Stylosanthes scabra]
MGWRELVEFYNNNKSFEQETPFKSLESLTFESMPCWKEWHFPDEFDGFPQLKHLSIYKCPVLTGNLPSHLPTLEELIVEGCGELACSLPRRKEEAPQSLLARPVSGVHLLGSLQQLSISGCSNLTFSGQLQHSLKKIFISECDSLKLFPLVALPNLEKLQIRSCRNLECIEVPQDHDDHVLPSLCQLIIHLEELTIEWCSEIDSFPEVGLPPSLRVLRIHYCRKLTRWIISRGLHSEGLTTLSLSGCDKVKSFPREGCLPISLEHLKISKFRDVETLDCKALLHLTSLEELEIQECRTLKNMTEEWLPPSITRLDISACPLRSKLRQMNHPAIDFDDLEYLCGSLQN